MHIPLALSRITAGHGRQTQTTEQRGQSQGRSGDKDFPQPFLSAVKTFKSHVSADKWLAWAAFGAHRVFHTTSQTGVLPCPRRGRSANNMPAKMESGHVQAWLYPRRVVPDASWPLLHGLASDKVFKHSTPLALHRCCHTIPKRTLAHSRSWLATRHSRAHPSRGWKRLNPAMVCSHAQSLRSS